MTLTTAQKIIVNEMKAGRQLVRAFDVWDGYHWLLRPGNNKVHRDSVKALEHAGVIKAGESRRVYSGYQELFYTLTEAA